MYDVALVQSVRRKLHELIAGKCRRLGVDFKPQVGDEKIDQLTGRVLHVEIDNRQIFVDLNEYTNCFAFDGFVKTVGVDDNVLRLQLSYEPKYFSDEKIWFLYHKWLIERVEQSELEFLVKDFFDQAKSLISVSGDIA